MFNWAEYLLLAKELAEDNSEAKKRSAISRAYYAAFHIAAQYLVDNDCDFYLTKTREDHDKIWSTLKSPVPGKKRQESAAGEHGIRLKEMRRKADYEDTIQNVEKTTELAIRRSENLIRSLQSLTK